MSRKHTQGTHAHQAYALPEGRNAALAKPRRSVGWTIVFWLALAVFLVALFFAGRIVLSYWHGTAQYENLAEEVLTVPSDETTLTLVDLRVDWDSLFATNADTIGWLYVPGTVINYPVVWNGNDYTYLTRTFDGTTSGNVTFGTLFLEGENAPDLSDPHNVIFGHAMKNGTMFGPFYRMSWNGTFDEFRDIYLLTPQGNLHLRTFAYVHVPATEMAVMTARFATDNDFISFIQNKINRTMFTPSDEIPDPSAMGKIFSFITCDSAQSTGRYIVYAYVFESTIPSIEGIGHQDPNEGSGVTVELIDGLGW